MGRRAWLADKEKYPWFKMSNRWPGKGVGRYWKRRLSKARRRYAKQELMQDRPHMRGLPNLESEVNWRTW